MTNEVMNLSVTIREPICTLSWIWMAAVVVVPAISIGVLAQSWTSHRHGKETSWQPKTILLAALALASLTLIQISTKLNEVFHFAATQTWGAALQAMAHITYAHCCTYFTVGTASTALTLAVLVLLPQRSLRKGPPTA